MGSSTQAKTIEDLKKELADKEKELQDQRDKEQEKKYETLEEEVKDIRKRLISKLFEKDSEHDRRILELEIAYREAEGDAKKSSLTIAGGGVSIVLILEALQAYLGIGAAG